MGKYIKKTKATGEVAVMEVSQSIGVRTRAKTLALRMLQNAATSISSPDSSYLQLRSRRLEKPVVVGSMNSKKSKEFSKQAQEFKPNTLSNPRLSLEIRSVSVGESVLEVSCGENMLEIDELERVFVGDVCEYLIFPYQKQLPRNMPFGNARETTPCSLIRCSESLETPSSTNRSKQHSSMTDKRIQTRFPQSIPSTHEMEDFFAGAELQQQRSFIEKYNFDPVRDIPLPGRYEWIRLSE